MFPCFEEDTWSGDKLRTRKSPDTNRGFYDATLDQGVVLEYWTAMPKRLVGVRIPDDIVVLDIDVKIDPPVDGFQTLEAEDLEYPETHTVITPSGGMHLYYKKDPELKAKPTSNLKLRDGRVLSGIDRRTAGSYAIAYSIDAPVVAKLTDSPEWLLHETDQVDINTYSGGLTKWLSELPKGNPDKRVANAIRRFPQNEFGHTNMIRMQTELIKLGSELHTGVELALEKLKSLWLSGKHNTLRNQADWNSALEGGVRKYGNFADSKFELMTPGDETRALDAISPVADSNDSAATEWVAENLNGEFCWTKFTGWLHYEKGIWKPCSDESLREAIRKLFHSRWSESRKVPELQWQTPILKGFLSKPRLSGLESLLRGKLEVQPDVLDGHADLLNAKNGVVDLQTGELLPHDPSYFFTRQAICEYQVHAKHPDWEMALLAIPDFALDYLQAFLGQGLTGYILSEDLALVLGGGGRNGKSTICDMALKVLGNFAVLASPALLTGRDSDHTTELTDLIGRRFALLEEFPRLGSLNTSRLKRVVGTAEISARRMRQDNQTWDATHTLVITTNHEIQIASGDDGTWRRLVKINLPYRYVAEPVLPNDRKVELGLRERLKEGAEGQHEAALAWLVQGAMTWFANDRKLPKLPKEIEADIAEWRQSQDSLGSFLNDLLEVDAKSWVAQSDLHALFKREHRDDDLYLEKPFALALKSHEFVVSNGLKVESKQRTTGKMVSRPPTESGSWIQNGALPKQATLLKGVRFKT